MAKVMVVDDEKIVLDMVQAVLEVSGHQTETFSDPAKALEALHDSGREPPRLIVLDVMMPGIDGMEFVRRLRADPRTATIPVVVISSVKEFAGKFSDDKKVVAFVAKPFTIGSLRTTLRNAL